jgi:hypothetical protein
MYTPFDEEIPNNQLGRNKYRRENQKIKYRAADHSVRQKAQRQKLNE